MLPIALKYSPNRNIYLKKIYQNKLLGYLRSNQVRNLKN